MYKQNNIKEKKYFKKAVLYGGVGLAISTANYIISENLEFSSMFKTISNMNTQEITAGILFGVSLMSTLSGGVMYGMAHFLEQEDKKDEEEKLNLLEKKLEN